MLSTLYIENIAVIEKTNIDFTKGLNVLTGETGAGKSIIIDSINAVTGHRTSKDIIRTGSDSAFVSATFTNISKEIKEKELNSLDDYKEAYGSDSYGLTAFLLSRIRIFSICLKQKLIAWTRCNTFYNE